MLLMNFHMATIMGAMEVTEDEGLTRLRDPMWMPEMKGH